MPVPEFPPVEWVEGDPTRSTQFAFATGAFFGIGLAFLAVFLFTILGEAGLVPSAGVPFWPFMFGVYGLLAVELPFVYLFPRRHPIVARLGFSPVGLRLALPMRPIKVDWRSVRWTGPDQIEVQIPLGSQKYLLTSNQAARLARFVHTL